MEKESKRSKLKMSVRSSSRCYLYHLQNNKYTLPQSDIEFIESEWNEWICRIDTAFKIAKSRLCESNQYDIDEASEDYAKAECISNNMYSALIVSVWAMVESILKRLCQILESLGFGKLKGNFNIDTVREYLNNGNILININNVHYWNETNVVRRLNNSFKHDNNVYRYNKCDDDFVKDVALKYNIPIIENGKLMQSADINYSNIKLKALIMSVSIFCFKLIEEVDSKIASKTE